jgi:hypothetical protein
MPVYGHSGGSSHKHPHDPEKAVCVGCAELVTPGSHYCIKDQKKDVKLTNAEANVRRLEKKVDDKDDKSFGEVVKEVVVDHILTPAEKVATKIGEWITGKKGNVKCPSCGDWVSHEKEHWGTGSCAIGHEHWTCAPGAKEQHAGCYWVNEPETNPDAMYQKAKYSVTCSHGCGTTRWTNNLDEYMRWSRDPYCWMYGSQ